MAGIVNSFSVVADIPVLSCRTTEDIVLPSHLLFSFPVILL